jgi:hypothetical protein
MIAATTLIALMAAAVQAEMSQRYVFPQWGGGGVHG